MDTVCLDLPRWHELIMDAGLLKESGTGTTAQAPAGWRWRLWGAGGPRPPRGHAPAAAFQSWLAALDGAPTLVIAFGGSRLGALRRRCGDAGVALAALREAGDATMRTTLREALMALLTGAAAPASRYDGDEAFYAPGEAALDAPDGDDGVVEEPASSPKVIEDRDAWLQNLAARAGDQEAPATPTAAAAAAAPTPESSNARSFFEGLLNSPGK